MKYIPRIIVIVCYWQKSFIVGICDLPFEPVRTAPDLEWASEKTTAPSDELLSRSDASAPGSEELLSTSTT
jgi:hypothetical protein